MNTPTILYPVACDRNGFAIHIDDWERGQEVTCFGCGEQLVGRLPHDGIKPTAHFAHKADAECSGETALHKAGRAAIFNGHGKGTLHTLLWDCPHCKRYQHSTDLRVLALSEEARPCEGVVSDVLAFDAAGAPRVAIEVVVTHDIESETLARYRACGVDVLSIRPSWGILGDIVRGAGSLVVVHRVGVVDTSSCPGCQEILSEKLAWEQRDRDRKDQQWWTSWLGMWHRIGQEAYRRSEAEWLVAEMCDASEQKWWAAWFGLWGRIARDRYDVWCIEWHQLWIDIGVEYMRPRRWWRRWLSVWEAIGGLYLADEVESARKRRSWEDRAAFWWELWIRMWKDIGQRESGALAAWRPLCRLCRDDLRPDHLCPRADMAG